MIEILDLNSIVYCKSIYVTNIFIYILLVSTLSIYSALYHSLVSWRLTSWAKWLQSRCTSSGVCYDCSVKQKTLNHLDLICFNSNSKTEKKNKNKKKHNSTSKWICYVIVPKRILFLWKKNMKKPNLPALPSQLPQIRFNLHTICLVSPKSPHVGWELPHLRRNTSMAGCFPKDPWDERTFTYIEWLISMVN